MFMDLSYPYSSDDFGFHRCRPLSTRKCRKHQFDDFVCPFRYEIVPAKSKEPADRDIIDDAEKFEVQLNVDHFNPEDLSVNLRENELVVEGHHAERSDANCRIERHFIRKYELPENVLMDSLKSHLTNEGVLKIAARKFASDAEPSCSIPIQTVANETK